MCVVMVQIEANYPFKLCNWAREAELFKLRKFVKHKECVTLVSEMIRRSLRSPMSVAVRLAFCWTISPKGRLDGIGKRLWK